MFLLCATSKGLGLISVCGPKIRSIKVSVRWAARVGFFLIVVCGLDGPKAFIILHKIF